MINEKHFPQDGTGMWNEFDKQIKRRELLRKRDRFYHRSRGLSSFRKALSEAISTGKDTDYDGEDESPCLIFDEDVAVTAVIEMLKRRGLLKYIK